MDEVYKVGKVYRVHKVVVLKLITLSTFQLTTFNRNTFLVAAVTLNLSSIL